MVVRLGITDVPEHKPETAGRESGGENGNRAVESRPQEAVSPEIERARDIARRYRCEFVDLRNFQLQHDLFKKVPGAPDVPLQLRPAGRDRRTGAWPSPSPIPAS